MTVSANSTPSSVRSLRLCSTVRRNPPNWEVPRRGHLASPPPTRRSGTTKPPPPGRPPPPRTGTTSRRARSDGAMCHRTVRPRKKETQRAEALPFAGCRWPLREKGIAANTSVVSYGLISCTAQVCMITVSRFNLFNCWREKKSNNSELI